jgi:hypothetical protein
MATENLMCNRKSARHTSIVEYETALPKAVKYDESQQKRIRCLTKTQLFRDILPTVTLQMKILWLAALSFLFFNFFLILMFEI